MSVRTIVEWPEKVLETRAQEVTEFDDSVRQLVQDLHDTMDASTAVGLAANQIGELKRIFVAKLKYSAQHDDARMWWHDKRLTFINPLIKRKVGRASNVEGCMSFPGIFEYVERSEEVTVEAYDENGKKFEITGSEYLAACIQHEIDHLDGIIFVNRMSRLKAAMVRKKLQKKLLYAEAPE